MPMQLTVIRITGLPGDDPSMGIWVGRTFDLVKDEVRFGRHPANDIPLFSCGKARHQGRLSRVGDDYYIHGFPGVSHRTLVNGERITAGRLLADGDVISVFRVDLVYRRTQQGEADASSESP